MLAPAAYFSQIQALYEERDCTETARFWRELDLMQIAKALPRRCDTLLDLGCGNGFYAQALASRFRSTILVDVSPVMIRAAEQRVACTGRANDERQSYIHDISLGLDMIPTRSCSFVLLNGCTLSYIEHPQIALAEVGRVLSADGRAWIDTWSACGLLLRSYRSHGLQTDMPDLARATEECDIEALQEFLQTGLAVERALNANDAVAIHATTLPKALETLSKAGLQVYGQFGRKALELVVPARRLTSFLASSPVQARSIELLLSSMPQIVESCPSMTFVAGKA